MSRLLNLSVSEETSIWRTKLAKNYSKTKRQGFKQNLNAVPTKLNVLFYPHQIRPPHGENMNGSLPAIIE